MTEHLNPCHWSEKPPTVALAVNQNLTRNLQAAKGAFVRVRVNDPNRRLIAPDAAGRKPPLFIGVWSISGVFLSLAATAEDSQGRNYQILAPENMRLKMSVASGTLELEDEKRAPLGPGGATFDFQRTPGDDHKKAIVLNIK